MEAIQDLRVGGLSKSSSRYSFERLAMIAIGWIKYQAPRVGPVHTQQRMLKYSKSFNLIN